MSSGEQHELLEEAPLNPPSLENLHMAEDDDAFDSSGANVTFAGSEHPGPGFSSPPRNLTNLNGLALVIGLQIGSGIFSAPAVVITKVPLPILAVFVWLLAGVLVWTGAASFIELGTRVPQNGGIQEYLRHCYGDVYGFLFAWIWLLVSRPCAMAMVALVFSEYLFKAVSPQQDVSIWVLKVTALLAIIFITCLNGMGTNVGTGAANFFLVLKICGLGSVAIIGLVTFTGFWNQDGNNHPIPPTTTGVTDPHIWTNLGNFTDAILAALFAYGGWESISFVAGEIKEPHYALPRILSLSMVIVIALFTLANITFYNTLSLETLQGTNAVAVAFGMEIFGTPGAIFYAWIVCLSCLGALNSIVFSTGRLTQAAGARHYLPAFLKSSAGLPAELPHNRTAPASFSSRICPAPNRAKNQNIPLNAMMLNAAVATIYVAIGSFRGLLSFKGMVEYLVYLTAVSGLLLLRFTADTEPRSRVYLTPIYNPVIFSCIAALIVVRSAVAHIVQALIIVLLFGASSLVYRSRWWSKLVSTSTAAPDSE